MKKNMILGFSGFAAASGLFFYFAATAVHRNQPKMPLTVNRRVIHHQQDDRFAAQREEAVKSFAAFPQKRLTQVSADGLLLKGVLFASDEPKRLIIFMHGWRSSWQKDFGILVETLLKEDCALFFADERAHGESEGKYITYGVKEKEDCVLWTEQLSADYPDLPVYLWGMSMGATVVMLAGAEQLPANVRGVIADCGYNNARTEMEHLIRKKIFVAERLVTSIYRPYFRRLCDFDIESFSTEQALAQSDLPILLFHGKEDDFVPPVMSKRNYAAAKGEKELVLIDGAVHCKCFYVNPEKCFAEVRSFFARHDRGRA